MAFLLINTANWVLPLKRKDWFLTMNMLLPTGILTVGEDLTLFHCHWKRGRVMSIPKDILQDLCQDLAIDPSEITEISDFLSDFGDNDLIELFNTVVKTKESE